MHEEMIKKIQALVDEARKQERPRDAIHFEAGINCGESWMQHLKYDREIRTPAPEQAKA